MSDNAAQHAKILEFLATELARKDGRQCVHIDLLYAPGNGFHDALVRRWSPDDEPELFDTFARSEDFVRTILEIAENEADAKDIGKHRFVVRTQQHLGGRATLSFALLSNYNGDVADEVRRAISSVPSVAAAAPTALAPVGTEQLLTEVMVALLMDLRKENVALSERATELRIEIEVLKCKRADRPTPADLQRFEEALRQENGALSASNAELSAANERLRAELAAAKA